MSTSTTPTLTVSSCMLDARCKATLIIMMNNGWTKAGTVYQTSQQVLSVAELRHLKMHGVFSPHSEPHATLGMLAPAPDGDVYFRLDVDLA